MSGPIDFSEEEWFQHLQTTRRFLWTEEERDRFAARFGLGSGLQVADFGCGWGYLGHLLAPFLQPGGRITGFDLSERLVAQARERAQKRGLQGRLRFELGDARDLAEVDDASFDRALCQTVLMHQSQPEAVLAEMRRVVRPGGLVAAIEPDLMLASCSAIDALDRDDWALQRQRMRLMSHYLEGVQRSGGGDYRVGSRLLSLFHAAGLQQLQHWLHPVLYQLVPPYEGPLDEAQQAHRLDLASDESTRAEFEHLGDLVVAGGGPLELLEAVKAAELGRQPERRELLRSGRYTFATTNAFFVCIGQVP